MNANGKGSKPRPTDIKKFNENYESINWHDKEEELVTTKELISFNNCCGGNCGCRNSSGISESEIH